MADISTPNLDYNDMLEAWDINDALMQIVAENHLTCLMITHNMASALELGNRTIMMDRGHIIHDAAGEKRDGLTVEKLLQEFKNASGAALDNDRMLLT